MKLRALIFAATLAGLLLPAHAQRGIEPVHYFNLINCLARTPNGYTSSKPVGAKVVTGGSYTTEASRQYSKKDRPRKVIRIKITDGAYKPSFYEEFQSTRDFNNELPDGYYSGYKIAGCSVHERYNSRRREGTLRGVVEGRFIVEITGYDMDPAELVSWWQRVNIPMLAALH
ncbi:MAG: hypothetical protein HZA91_03820 [Verrucomicrobia bacterium]|nr:hypothetical protein [Verrucomicrobiota bacterium]